MSENNGKKIRTGLLVGKSLLAKLSLPVLLVILVLISVIIIIIAVIVGNDFGSDDIKGGNKKLPESVLRWEDDIEHALSENNVDKKHLPVMLSILKQESNGDLSSTGGDIFQSSESKCGSIGCITDPKESIDQAVKHFKNNLKKADGNIEVAIASYNFGNGFAEWTKEKHDNKWSVDIAIEFSQHMMEKVSNPENYTCVRKEAKEHNACFGDILYVQSIKEYMPSENGGDGKETEIIKGDLNAPLDRELIVTSPFSWRDIGAGDEHHNGLDLECTSADTIHSVQDGEVVHAGQVSGYGNYVLIKHGDDQYTGYGHMSSISVSNGDDIEGGNEVGVCGSTGRSTGEHLHFEVKSDEWDGFADPAGYLGL